MDFTTFIAIEFIYVLIVATSAILVYLRTQKYYKLSGHKGISFFSNAFLFYSIAFLIKLIINFSMDTSCFECHHHNPVLKFFFLFFISLAGFYLVFSILGRQIEIAKLHGDKKTCKFCDLVSKYGKLMLIVAAAIIALLETMYWMNHIIFIPQLLIHLFAIKVIWCYYKKMRNKPTAKYTKVFMAIMSLNFIAWAINYILALKREMMPQLFIPVYIITALIFVLFVYIIFSLEKKFRLKNAKKKRKT